MHLVFRNGLGIGLVYLLRFLMLFQSSIISSILTLVEKAKYGLLIKEQKLESDPIFIIGHWRTGSTYLHQLMSLDSNFTTPQLIQTVIPDHFLFSTKYYLPILQRTIPPTRPMDNVRLSPFEPQEDEFALLRMGCESPVEKLLFPRKKEYFLSTYDEYIPRGKQLEKWKSSLMMFYKKLTLQNKGQIVSKNPYHTMRLPLLMQMFPDARFIHIRRDPLDVVPSTIRMWDSVARENKMKRGWKSPSAAEVASVLNLFLSFVRSEKQKLDQSRFTELRFEDLEADPVKELKRIYEKLDLEYSREFETRISSFLNETKTYRKNTYHISEEEKSAILKIVEEESR